ncbi:MAG: PucC family protein [bacterium]
MDFEQPQMAGLGREARWLEPALLVFGAGFGVYTFGGLSLMAVMSPDRHAGAYLGLWTIATLVFRGLGTFLGGALRDLFILQIAFDPSLGYALVFALEAGGLALAVAILARVDILTFARETGRVLARNDVQVAGLD